MCGIAGIIDKNESKLSDTIIDILSLIQHRGPDATGIAFYDRDDQQQEKSLRLSLTDSKARLKLNDIINEYGGQVSKESSEINKNFSFLDMKLKLAEENISGLHKAINQTEALYVHSIGKKCRVYKDSGTAVELCKNHQIEEKSASHGIGHVRMATESAEDINAAHPFVSPFYSDLTIVHNGQLTNYFNLRRELESKGAIFKTMNDSEAASHLISYRMKENGGDLEDALHYSLEKLDGIFCIIAASSDQMGFVKDKMGVKPLLVFEKDGVILMGSEQIEFTPIFEDIYAREMEPSEVKVWSI
ncbi:class II glutamine amidotransferase [Halanaerobium hydrogeniformans]|uniref:Glutamine amidotransferase class-II n=1 Tax=Halanaerobium hydrogeniformans TaxID=656519 RepID=E4RP02_HALHG|nr:class II glutamine amidotransferase [Halanaerobium hydrogeniformans]ADQ13692.1 glutamine amidotransferase class-II [Halanaerobium hydrogeniformans]